MNDERKRAAKLWLAFLVIALTLVVWPNVSYGMRWRWHWLPLFPYPIPIPVPD